MALHLLWSDITALPDFGLVFRERSTRTTAPIPPWVHESTGKRFWWCLTHESSLFLFFPSRTPLLRLHPDFCCEAFCQILWPGPSLGFFLIVVTEGVFITCVCVLVVPCIVCLIRFIIRLCVCIFAYCYLYSRRVCVWVIVPLPLLCFFCTNTFELDLVPLTVHAPTYYDQMQKSNALQEWILMNLRSGMGSTNMLEWLFAAIRKIRQN